MIPLKGSSSATDEKSESPSDGANVGSLDGEVTFGAEVVVGAGLLSCGRLLVRVRTAARRVWCRCCSFLVLLYS